MNQTNQSDYTLLSLSLRNRLNLIFDQVDLQTSAVENFLKLALESAENRVP